MPASQWSVEKGETLQVDFPARDLLGILLVLEILRLQCTYCSWFTHPSHPCMPPFPPHPEAEFLDEIQTKVL